MYYWPANAPFEETTAAFVAAFATIGYEECASEDMESGYEKVVLYAGASGAPTHMARQLVGGEWTSKLGQWFDIRHQSPDVVSGGEYGSICKVLKRLLAST